MKKRFRTEVAVGPRGFSDWLQPNMKKWMLACCDCHLVHEVQFRLVASPRGPVVQLRARRAARYTAQLRKKRK